MKIKILTACAALLFSGGQSFADGMYGSSKDPIMMPHAEYMWDGLYVGLHAGKAWGDAEYVEDGDDARRFSLDGFFGGVHAGYNLQRGRFVFGLEADYSAFDSDDRVVTGNGNVRHDLETSWLATIRGRIGITHESWLFYASAGAAFAELDTRRDNPGRTDSDTETVNGYAIGAGVEKMLTPNWTARLDYLYVDFGDEKFDAPGFDEGKTEFDAHILRVGVSYKIDMHRPHLESMK